MTRPITFVVLYAVLAVLLAPAISVAANDGEALPIYPHTHKGGSAREPTDENAVTQAVMHGSHESLYTTVERLSSWVRSDSPFAW
jgi:hypothetical protein